MKYAEVIVNNNSANFKDSFTYEIGEELFASIEVGMRVVIPFGASNKKLMGIVIAIKDEYNNKYKIKRIYSLVDSKPIISKKMIELGLWIKDKYLSNYIDAFQLVLPPGDYKKLVNLISINDNLSKEKLNLEELYLYEYVNKKGEISLEELRVFSLENNLEDELDFLLRENLFSSNIGVKTYGKKLKKAFVEVNKEITFESALEIIGSKAKGQIDLYRTASEKGIISLSDLLEVTGRSRSILKTLEEKGLIKLVYKTVDREAINRNIEVYHKHILNEEQQNAMDYIKSMIEINGDGNVFLLKGVTGSGKTEVYLQMVEETIKSGRDSIILVPEISLTPQTVDRFVGRFKDSVAIIHSKLSQGERFDQWRKIESGQVKIVVGARSAIFAPFKNLGLIVIDEEHENTYKSGQNPKYSTLEVGRKRIEIEGGNIILGSATPSIESYYASINEDIHLLELKTRTNDMPPQMEIVDMRKEISLGNRSIFSHSLRESLEENLERKKISILFLNRKGYSTFVSCRSCGYVVKCEECDIAMTYYKDLGRLKCNYCGITKVNPTICPECGSNYIKYFGIGTEQVEKIVRDEFPAARILRMDGETTSKKNSHEEKLELIKQGQVDILIGTQMIAKGLDFKDVTLVGIIAADTSLNLPDFRASEKTFQLITQVAGRAGRGDEEGRVIIQTYNPEHESIVNASREDYETFYKSEIKIREAFKYPPFIEIFNILIYGEDLRKVETTSRKIFSILEREYGPLLENKNLSDFLIGPYPAVFERVKKNFRYQIIVKFEKNSFIQLKNILERVCIYNEYKMDFKDIKISIDRNPISII